MHGQGQKRSRITGLTSPIPPSPGAEGEGPPPTSDHGALASATLGSEGGVVGVSDSSSPYAGLVLTVPAGTQIGRSSSARMSLTMALPSSSPR